MMNKYSIIIFLLLILCFNSIVFSQDDQSLAQANNPLANMTAFNIQNYYIPSLYGLPDYSMNTAWLRFVTPTSRILWRASLPISTVPRDEGNPVSGLGDFNVFATYLLSDPSAGAQFGIGPLLVVPTATNNLLGSGKWQLGGALVYFNGSSPQIQYGGLVTWQASIAGNEDRINTNFLVLQPFGIWQIGSGVYLRTAPLWAFNIESGDYNVPFGLGIGKVIKVGKTVYNIFFEPQYTILHYGTGQPEFQLFVGLNIQFMGN